MKMQMINLLLVLCSLQGFSQAAGDEDRDMLNKGKQRDLEVINTAKNGWWTASMQTHDQRIAWWREAKFGMFIHWGIYSLPGGEWKGQRVNGYAEHLMRKEKITRSEYLELAHQFNPVQFNAEEWILNAKRAGMKYFIITAKHHDGFAMFDSKVSDFNIVQQTPFKRDPMAELAAAAHRHGMKFGFYYSHAFDWEHPHAPGNDWEYKNPGGDLDLYGGRNWYDVHPELLPMAVRYVNEKAIPQINELLTKYHPDIIWFDTPHKLPLSENIRILQAIRETDPNVVVNGRLARNGTTNFGDYLNTADRPAEFYPVSGDWEAIPTTNESYGYHKYDSSHKSVGHFIQLLASAASKGGNLLMNIGPKGDGAFDVRDIAILNGIGAWMNKYGESIYGTSAGPLTGQNWGVSTWKENKLFLHVFKWPTDGILYVGGVKPAKAWLLKDPGHPIKIQNPSSGDLRLLVPAVAPDSIDAVIVLEYAKKPPVNTTYLVTPNKTSNRLLAFDAQQNGSGFNFGDGKTGRYYIEGWKKMEQSLTWRLRTIKTMSFKVVIKYLAPVETSGGSFSVAVNKKQFQQAVSPGNVTLELGTITLPAGIHTLQVQPLRITKDELMKLLEIQLIPLPPPLTSQ
jgi:alpha-L-fucosidase